MGLLRWAGSEERDQRAASATLAYRFLSENPANLNLSDEIRQKAQGRLDILAGGGSVGARVEYQVSRFTHELSNPAYIAAFATGSAVFSVGRAALLARLVSPGQAVLGARFLATAGAFSLEVPAVWATAKGVTELIAPGAQSWSADTNLRELAGLAITLGAFKFGAGAAGRFAASTPPVARSAMVQSGALAGLALSRQIEVAVGLRAPSDGASVAIDSLALLVQANVGGRIGSLGSRFQAKTQALENIARQGESVRWARLSTSLRGQGPDMIGQGPDMVFAGQGPDMVFRGQGPDMIRPISGQGPDMIRPADGQGPDMIRPVFGQGPDMRTALH
ncbi:MAG TPA: hypothetical protein VJP40_05940 [bacterium]|nr:hypothetical protein [bacterium]